MVFLFAANAGGEAASASPDFLIVPAILLGLAISFVELIFVHQDEHGMGWLAHGLHAVPVTMVFTFVTMNVPFAMSFFPQVHYLSWMEPLVIIVIGLIAVAKVLAAAAIAGKVGEKKIHGLIIGLLIMAAPYAWKFVLSDMVGDMLPSLPF